jgi:hypothetical protein
VPVDWSVSMPLTLPCITRWIMSRTRKSVRRRGHESMRKHIVAQVCNVHNNTNSQTKSITKPVHSQVELCKDIAKSTIVCVCCLLLPKPLLRHDVTTLDGRIPPLASAWMW